MATYKNAGAEVRKLGANLLSRYESHKPLLDAKVVVDYVFAYGARDEDGNLTGDALAKNGIRALGLTRAVPLKDRVMGRGDAEVCLDADWWTETATEEQQAALLDHELHHLTPKLKDGQFVYDSHGRPTLRLRKHDVEVGWFSLIADRHGSHSIEQMQAKVIVDRFGQCLFPQLVGPTQAVAKGRATAKE